MSDPILHHGSCHCQAVKYQVKLDLSKPVMACNCSICQRTGMLMAFVPESDFTLDQGQEAQVDYLWGQKSIHHLFCRTCGVRSYAKADFKGTPMAAINVRCLEDVTDITQLSVTHHNGRGS